MKTAKIQENWVSCCVSGVSKKIMTRRSFFSDRRFISGNRLHRGGLRSFWALELLGYCRNLQHDHR